MDRQSCKIIRLITEETPPTHAIIPSVRNLHKSEPIVPCEWETVKVINTFAAMKAAYRMSAVRFTRRSFVGFLKKKFKLKCVSRLN